MKKQTMKCLVYHWITGGFFCQGKNIVLTSFCQGKNEKILFFAKEHDKITL